MDIGSLAGGPGLKLIRRPGYGFEIEDELDIRKAIVSAA
jgi:hypothetical protein